MKTKRKKTYFSQKGDNNWMQEIFILNEFHIYFVTS